MHVYMVSFLELFKISVYYLEHSHMYTTLECKILKRHVSA